MDLSTQETIKRLADEHGGDSLLVLLGAPDPESAGIAAETVVLGDPSWAGPLAGAQLGLPVYHILEDELRAAVPDDVWGRAGRADGRRTGGERDRRRGPRVPRAGAVSASTTVPPRIATARHVPALLL